MKTRKSTPKGDLPDTDTLNERLREFRAQQSNYLAAYAGADSGKLLLGAHMVFDDWMEAMDWQDLQQAEVYPQNCFPTMDHKRAYLRVIPSLDDAQVRSMLRRFLNKSQSYGIDRIKQQLAIAQVGQLLTGSGGRNLDGILSQMSEFDVRMLKGQGWEGITWVLDLLPHFPHDAIRAIESYALAYAQDFTDQMLSGHQDAIDIIRERFGIGKLMSVTIIHGQPDIDFAIKLRLRLEELGVDVFMFLTDATPGEKLHRASKKAVNAKDRVILICSRASLQRGAVLYEIEETLAREAREGGKIYLIPIRLDDYVLSEWLPPDPDIAQSVRDRVIADFIGAENDDHKFREGIASLLSALHRT